MSVEARQAFEGNETVKPEVPVVAGRHISIGEVLDTEDVDGNPIQLLSTDEQKQPVILELLEPIEDHGTQVTEIKIRPPIARDMLRLQRQKMDENRRNLLWFSALTELAPESIESLTLKDFRRLSTVVWAFAE